MYKLSELVASVAKFLQEASVSDAEIIAFINEGIKHTATKLLLPELESFGTFNTVPGSTEVAIPVIWNFHRNIYSAETATDDIKVYPSVAHLADKAEVSFNSNTEGPIKFLTTRNAYIVYHGSPSEAETVYCKFYKNPSPLVKGSDIPSYIPEGYQKSVLENYALWKLFALKEDGIEGLKTNTLYHKGLFKEAFEELDFSIKENISEPDVDRETSWI